MNVFLQIFKAKETDELYSHQIDMDRLTPQEGWVEQDPKAINDAIETCINKVLEKMEEEELGSKNIATIGICNARETTIAWDSRTGDHLYNAIRKCKHGYESWVSRTRLKRNNANRVVNLRPKTGFSWPRCSRIGKSIFKNFLLHLRVRFVFSRSIGRC